MTDREIYVGKLDELRKPFESHQISKLPKQAKWMTDAKNEYKNCDVCGGYHHPKAAHLDYVGHAALTDRLLDVDPFWTWKPLSLDQNGVPYFDNNGGLWIELTVCGMTRLGYGHPDGKKGGDAIKEAIGDALRNAAMRFGAALDLWHKGDLHNEEKSQDESAKTFQFTREHKIFQRDFYYGLGQCSTIPAINSYMEAWKDDFANAPDQVTSVLKDQVEVRKQVIRNDKTAPPIKFGFVDVQEAIDFAKQAKDNVDKMPNYELSGWMLDNDDKLKALDEKLSADKYQTDEGSPYQRIVNAYNAKLKEKK